jgi:hypothetical protein
MTEEELNSLREKDITQWVIKNGEKRMLEDIGQTPKLLSLKLSEFLKVDFSAVMEAKKHWHTTNTTRKH